MSLQSQLGSKGLYASETIGTIIPSSLHEYCNAPHLTAGTYLKPEPQRQGHAELVHVIHIQRHHRRTPDNLVPRNEAVFNPSKGWKCENIQENVQYSVDRKFSSVMQNLYEVPQWNPMHSLIWNGTCTTGQLTAAGLHDSYHHGRDISAVYGPKGVNPLLPERFCDDNEEKHAILVRTSPEPRTIDVASGVLRGMGCPKEGIIPAHTHPDTIDGIVPSYACSYTDDLRQKIEEEKTWQDHLQNASSLFDTINDVLGTGDETSWNTWMDHAFDFLSSRQCHHHSLPENPENEKRISQDVADEVYAVGNWEYNYIWNDSPNADEYVKYSIAVLIKEVNEYLQSIQLGQLSRKMTLVVGHDGTMVRLLKTLGQPRIPWPSLGSNLQMEIYRDKRSSKFFVRFLANGKILQSTVRALTDRNETSEVEWVSLEKIISFLESRVPEDLFEKCTA